MALIDATYFVGQITIAQVETPPVAEKLQGFINKYEPDILRKLLGKECYRAFVDGIAEPVPEQRWIDLRDGVQDEWMGFVNADKLSVIANYVYFWYTRDQASLTTGVGEVIPKSENAASYSFVNKQVRAWNEMVDWIQELHVFLDVHSAEYPEYQPTDGYHGFHGKKHRIHYPFCKINSLNL